MYDKLFIIIIAAIVVHFYSLLIVILPAQNVIDAT